MATPVLSATVPEAEHQPDLAPPPAVVQAALRGYEESACMSGQVVERAEARQRDIDNHRSEVTLEAARNALPQLPRMWHC